MNIGASAWRIAVKTTDEIILFLIRNGVPDKFSPVTQETVKFHKELDDGNTPLDLLLMRLSHVTPRYSIPLKDFEAFVGESFSFEKHLRAVHEEGAIVFQVAPPDTFYDSASYRKAFDKTNGLVGDKNGSYVVFRILGGRPKSSKQESDMYGPFLDNLRAIQRNATELGLYGELPKKNKVKGRRK